MHVARILILVGVTSLSAGCGVFFPNISGAMSRKAERDTFAKLREARQKKDTAYIAEQCKDDGSNVSRTACEYRRQIALEDNPSCDAIAAEYKEPNPDHGNVHLHAMAKRFAACGKFEIVFERMYDRGTWKVLLDEGLPVLEEAAKYARSHPGPRLLAAAGDKRKAMADFVGGLLHFKQTQHCDVVTTAVKDADPKIQLAALEYFAGARCAEATPIAVPFLLDADPDHRRWTCRKLGDFGDASVLEKLDVLAQTDAHNVVKEEERSDASGKRFYAVKTFPVREACTEAMGKIRLRHAG